MSTIEALADVIDKLPVGQQSFARSLIKQAKQHPLSEKQSYWVAELTRRALQVPVQREKHALGDISGVVQLFDKAKQHLKFPKILLSLPDGKQIRLSVAGTRARQPGTINVGDVAKYGEGEWYGRVLKSGEFEKSPKAEIPAGLLEQLKRLADEPAKVASEYGKLTGNCCFCRLPLTDVRSTDVGYGPTCAGHYGLPWGE